jgi:hypothetical protein
VFCAQGDHATIIVPLPELSGRDLILHSVCRRICTRNRFGRLAQRIEHLLHTQRLPRLAAERRKLASTKFGKASAPSDLPAGIISHVTFHSFFLNCVPRFSGKHNDRQEYRFLRSLLSPVHYHSTVAQDCEEVIPSNILEIAEIVHINPLCLPGSGINRFGKHP